MDEQIKSKKHKAALLKQELLELEKQLSLLKEAQCPKGLNQERFVKEEIQRIDHKLCMLYEEKQSILISFEKVISDYESLKEIMSYYNLQDTIHYGDSFSLNEKTCLKTLENIGSSFNCYKYELLIIDWKNAFKRLSDYFEKQYLNVESEGMLKAFRQCFSLLNGSMSFEIEDFFLLLKNKISDLLEQKMNTFHIDIQVF